MKTVTNERQRRRRDARTPNPTPVQLTNRDEEIIKAVYENRVLRSDQIQQLFFGTKTATNARLAKLYDHHYLTRFILPSRGGLMSSPILYGIDKKGVEVLRALGYDLSWYPTYKALKESTLAHTVALADFRIAITLASRQLGYELTTWLSENELKANYDYVQIGTRWGVQRFPVVPDSYFCVTTSHHKVHFFVECDMATMTIGRFLNKVKAYIAYKSNGDYRRRYNAQTVRVLTITTGEKRLANLKRATEKADGKYLFWFAVADNLTPENILTESSCWQVAGQEGYHPLMKELEG